MGEKNKRSRETSCMTPKWWPKGKQKRRDFSVCVALSLILSVRRAMIERARFSSCVVTLSRSPDYEPFSPFFSFFTNVGSITIVLPIPNWKLSVSKTLLRIIGKKKKKRIRRYNGSFSIIHNDETLVAGRIFVDESYHLDISLFSFALRFYLKVKFSKYLSLWGRHRSDFEHDFTDVRDPSDLVELSRCYFSLAGPIEAEMYESRSMTRNRNALHSLVERCRTEWVMYPLEQIVKPSTKRFRFMAADKL